MDSIIRASVLNPLFTLWQKIKIIRRANKILVALFKAGFSYYFHKTSLLRHIPWAHRYAKIKTDDANLPIYFRQTLEKLGPVFVKFGQILSTRSDLLPAAYIIELEKLQTKVPPFSFKEARKIIENDFNKSVEEVFKHFEIKPFASASLGQVYKAVLHSGEKVAVKVQRPKAKEQIKLDTQVLLALAHLAEKHIHNAKSFNLIGIVQEFRRWTLNELDYRKEAGNCEIFANFFKDNEHIYSPKVFWEYSKGSTLTLEYIDGDSLADVVESKKYSAVDKEQISRHMADAFIKQYFEYGFFHADPHPGNIFVLPGNKLMFLDFGMVGFLDSRLTAFAAGLFLALLQKDVEKIISIALQLEADYDENIPNQEPQDAVKINNLRKDVTELVLQWGGRGQPGSFTMLFYNLINIAVKDKVSVPVDLIMLSKSVVTLDVVARKLYSGMRLEDWEKPLIERIILARYKPEKLKIHGQNVLLLLDEVINKLPESSASILRKIESGKFGMEINPGQLMEYERLLNTNTRINSFGTLLAAGIIAFALIYQGGFSLAIFNRRLPPLVLWAGIIVLLIYFINHKKKGI